LAEKRKIRGKNTLSFVGTKKFSKELHIWKGSSPQGDIVERILDDNSLLVEHRVYSTIYDDGRKKNIELECPLGIIG
jgi:hypothetical protein